jgi:hypothetical protein
LSLLQAFDRSLERFRHLLYWAGVLAKPLSAEKRQISSSFRPESESPRDLFGEQTFQMTLVPFCSPAGGQEEQRQESIN